jgi:hypothetical protein
MNAVHTSHNQNALQLIKKLLAAALLLLLTEDIKKQQ